MNNGNGRSQLLKNFNVITGELQHNLMIVDIDKKQEKKADWKPGSQKRNVAKLRDEPYRQLIECSIKEIMSDNHSDLWGSFRESVLKACDEVCGYKKNRKCNVNMYWWWNSGAKDEIQKKKEAYIEMTNNPTEETKNEYRRLKNAAKKAVARATLEEVARMINKIGRNPNNFFRLVKKMKIESTVVVGGRCM